MRREPLVSILIPTFDRAGFVVGAVRSALAQTLSDHEVIVIDDGSTDGTEQALGRICDPRLRVLRHDRNRGIAAARNTGLEAARGRFIAWLDSDDLARPRRLARQIRALDANPHVAMVGCCTGIFGCDGKRRRAIRVPPLTSRQIGAWLLFRSPFQQSSIMGRAEILRRYPYRHDIRVCEDLDLFIRLTAEHEVVNLPEILIDRRSHPGQLTRTERTTIQHRKAELLTPSLRELGIDFTETDLQRHLLLGKAKLAGAQVGADFLDWAEDWLRSLLSANAATRVVDEEGLRLAITFFWIRACLAAIRSLGPRRPARALLRSPLSWDFLTRESRRWMAQAAPLAMTSMLPL